jgi:AraC-like DNA-binding protein
VRFKTQIDTDWESFRPLLIAILFCWLNMISFAENNTADSIVAIVEGKPAEERIAYYSRKIFDYAHNNPGTAKTLIDSVSHLLKTHSNPNLEIYAFRSVSAYYLHRNQYDSAFYYVRKAEQLNDKNKDSIQQAKILIDYGNIYIAMGSTDSALVCYQAADSIAGPNYPDIKFNALLNIGSIYQTYKLDHFKSLEYFKKTAKLKDYAVNLNKIILFQKMSIAYRHTGNDSLALDMAQQSYDLAISEGLLGDAAAAINSLAQIYQEQGLYHQALEAFEKARDIAVKMELTKGIIFTNGNIADIYFEMGKYQEGLALYEKIHEIASNNKFDYLISMIYKKMIPFYKKLGDYRQALETSERLRMLEDSLALADKETRIAELETRYQLRIKEETIAHQQLQIKKDHSMIWMLSATILIVALSLIVISRLFVLKNKSMKNLVAAHKELTKKNKQIIKLLPAQSDTSINDSPDHMFERIFYYLVTKQHYLDETITLEKAATNMGINREYIRSAIKNAEGCSFKTFINNHRIDKAKTLIMEDVFSHFPIDEIAKKSGFSSRSSFYRAFQETTGFTPAYYKSQLKKHPASSN